MSRRWPNPDVLSRFPGFTPAQLASEILTAPTGNVTVQSGITGAQPGLNADPPVNEAFTRATDVVLPVVGDYVPAYAPTAAIGVLAIGVSAIGRIASYHNEINTAEGGADVEGSFSG